MAHAYLTGWTEIGEDNVIHIGAVIGHEPQDLAYRGYKTHLFIGCRNIIREHAQIHRGTTEGSATVIGNNNFFMHHSHVAHNCQIGNHTIIAGGALLAGYVQVEDQAFISGNCVVHQFVRIGKLALLRGLSRTSRDVPPFCIMDGTHTVRGVNLLGLKRAGYGSKRIHEVRRAFARLFRRRVNMARTVQEIEAENPSEDVAYLLHFIKASKRGVCFGVSAELAESNNFD
jgi:UDP-N-acetylglucosamine acyltransferase